MTDPAAVCYNLFREKREENKQMAKNNAKLVYDAVVGLTLSRNNKELTSAALWNNRAWGSRECVSSCWEDVFAAYADARDTDRMYYGR